MKTLKERVLHTLERYPAHIAARVTVKFFDYEEFLFVAEVQGKSHNWTLPKLQEFLRNLYFAETGTPIRFQPNRKHHYQKAMIKIEVKQTSSLFARVNM